MSEGLMERIKTEKELPERYIRPGELSVYQEIEVVPVDTGHGEQKPKSRQFLKSDELLADKAAFFYGMRGLDGTITSRFRILNKAMSAVMSMKGHPASMSWRNSFDTISSIKEGEEYQKTMIIFSDPDDGSQHKITAGQALLRPEMRAAVMGRFEAQAENEDPALHIIGYLKKWQEKLPIQPRPREQAGADRALEIFLFSVHGRQIVYEIGQLLNPSSSTEASRVE